MEELKLILNNLNQHKLIEVDELVRADFVRKYCQQNACGKYGRTWVCFEVNKKNINLSELSIMTMFYCLIMFIN